MIVIESDKTLFVDVDETLIMWNETGGTWRPHMKHIEYIKRFHARGQPIIVWSSGGYRWALEAVKELGLESYVHAVMAKPCWYMDDLPASEFMPEVNRIYYKESE